MYSILAYLLGWIIFFPSLMFLYTNINELVEYGYESGYGWQGESGDIDELKFVVKAGFNVLICIGVVIVSLLMLSFFHRIIKEEK